MRIFNIVFVKKPNKKKFRNTFRPVGILYLLLERNFLSAYVSVFPKKICTIQNIDIRRTTRKSNPSKSFPIQGQKIDLCFINIEAVLIFRKITQIATKYFWCKASLNSEVLLHECNIGKKLLIEGH